MSKPEKVIQNGNCRVSIFQNSMSCFDGCLPLRSVVLSKRYKDKEGIWKNSNTLDVNDIPKMIVALSRAYAYMTCIETNPQDKEMFGMGYQEVDSLFAYHC